MTTEETTTTTTLTILKDARSFESAHIAQDYPYGFRLRTQMFSWIEHTKSGARLVQQTINPKNGKLNAPKKSTYGRFKMIALNEDGHVRTIGYGDYSDSKEIESFLSKYSSYMNEKEIKDAQDSIKLKNYISKKFEEAEQQVKEKTYTSTEEIQAGQIILENNIKNYSGKIELWEVSLAGKAIKNKCRKEDFERKPIAYIKRDGHITDNEAREAIVKLTEEIQKTLGQYKAHKMKLTFDEVTFKNEGGSMFHSMARMLFSSTKLSFDV